MKIEALDIETIWDNDIAKPICIAITNNDTTLYKQIDTKDIDSNKILLFMLEKCNNNATYYVHNLSFEIFVFLRYMIIEDIKFKLVSSNKIIYAADIFYKNKKIKLRCSYRLTLMSLEKLTELAEVKKKEKFPYSILNKDIKQLTDITDIMFENKADYLEFIKKNGKIIKTFEILKNYCINDAIITKKSIIKFWNIIEENGLHNNGKILTAAKLSIENYFKNNNIVKKKIKLKYDRLIRPYYFGGRTEVFGNPYENEICLHYDWSGMYAQCMEEKLLGGEIIESDIIYDITKPGFYWIKFKQNLEIPVLPIKNNKLLFANGTFAGWYWYEEILLAIEMGVKIISIEKMITAQYYDFFLKDFVKINNEIRKIGPLHKQIGKNNNNSFYGRLGMDPERLEEEITNKIDNMKKYEKITKINGITIGYTKKEKSISNILISASITAKARIKLYNGIRTILENNGRILYTDTDSIIAAFDKKIYKKMLNKKLGEIFFDSNEEFTILKDAVFALPKTYALLDINNKEIVKIKGFNVKPNFKDFKEKFYKKQTILTENLEWNKKDFEIKKIYRLKETNLNNLDKRIWSEDYKKTQPLDLKEMSPI